MAARKTVQSVEPNIADLVNGWLKSYQLDYKLEQESLNAEIDKALNDYFSKNGGAGGNRPDVKLLLMDSKLDKYPILIEYKGYKDKLIKLDADGRVENRTAKNEPNYKNINAYVLPCLTSSFQNQGLNYYVPMDGATVLQNVISIPSNSDVYRAYFQPKAFTVLSDAYAIQWKNSGGNIANAQYLFFVSCINKVTDLPIYSYKNKLGGWNVVQNKYIQVPVKDGKINFEFMSNLISAIQKLVIRDVVSYSDQKLVATKQIIEND